MATNYIQPGRILTIPAPEAVASGGVVIAGEIVGIAQGDALAAAPVDVEVEGVWELPKVAAAKTLKFWRCPPRSTTTLLTVRTCSKSTIT